MFSHSLEIQRPFAGHNAELQLALTGLRQAARRRFGQNSSKKRTEFGRLHVPDSVLCPPQESPLDSRPPPVPFASALRLVRGDRLSDFEWIGQANNSSGECSSRKMASKEAAKREIDNWLFMYFRIRFADYRNAVQAIRQGGTQDSVYSEDNLDKWTHKFKFKIRRSAPFKSALTAFTSRLGVENDPDVVFCIDGFFGDLETGRIEHSNEAPNNCVLGSSTARAMGLVNGSSIFVSRCTDFDREKAFDQLQRDLQPFPDQSEEEEEVDSSDGYSKDKGK